MKIGGARIYCLINDWLVYINTVYLKIGKEDTNQPLTSFWKNILGTKQESWWLSCSSILLWLLWELIIEGEKLTAVVFRRKEVGALTIKFSLSTLLSGYHFNKLLKVLFITCWCVRKLELEELCTKVFLYRRDTT